MSVKKLRQNLVIEKLHELLKYQFEDNQLDFKATYDVREGYAELVKDIMAMANTNGGHVVFGVVENKKTSQFSPVGLPEDFGISELNLKREARRYLSHLPDFQIAMHPLDDGRRFGLLYVLKSDQPISAREEGYRKNPDDPRQNTKVFDRGAIYHRVGTENEPVKDITQFFGRFKHRSPAVEAGVLTREVQEPQGVSLSDALARELPEILTVSPTSKWRLSNVSTGFRDIDELTYGLHSGDLTLLAGRPDSGYSVFALNVARNAAVLSQSHVVYFSLGCSHSEVVRRLLAMDAAIDIGTLRRRQVDEKDKERLTTVSSYFEHTSIHIVDTSDLTAEDVAQYTLNLMHKQPVDLVIVDSLQLLGPVVYARSAPSAGRAHFESCRTLKQLATLAKCSVLATTSVSPSVDRRADKRPRLPDVQPGSEHADIILLLYRDDMYDWESEQKHLLDVTLVRNPYGPTGIVNLYIMDEILKMVGLERKR